MTPQGTVESDQPVRERLRAFFFASRLTRRSALPIALVAIDVLAYVGFLAAAPRTVTGEVHPVALLLAGAKVDTLVREGQGWRLVASVFLHADAVHLAINCIGGYFLAMFAANVFGWARAWVGYLACGVAGAVASTLWSPDPSVGASGAVYGLLGALGAFVLVQRRRLPPRLRLALGAGTVAWLAASIAYGFGAAHVDNAAHAGGLAAGVVLGLLAPRDLPVFSTSPVRTSWLLRAATVAAAAVVAWAGVMSARGLRLDFELPDPPLAATQLGDVTIPFPEGWVRGAGAGAGEAVECRAGDDLWDQAVASHGSVCARDPYGSVLLAGPAGALLGGFVVDPVMTVKGGLRSPRQIKRGNVDVRYVLLDRDHALMLANWDVMAGKYDGLLARILDGVRFQ